MNKRFIKKLDSPEGDLVFMSIYAVLFIAFCLLLAGCTFEKRHETIHTEDETTTTETFDLKRGKF
jgi:hypothetical protein